jgi:MFS family permease
LTDGPDDAARPDAVRGEALRRHPAFRRLVASRSISSLGDAISLVALLLYVAGSNGQAFAVAALLLVGDVAPVLLGPVGGAISDRFDLRSVMVSCELVQAAAVATIAATMPDLPMLLILVGVRAVAAHVFRPASRAVVPALVADTQLESANSALGFGGNGMEAFGPLLAAGLLPLLGIRGVLLVDAATFVISAGLLLGLPSLPPVGVLGARPALLREARVGIAYMMRAPVVRIVTLGFIGVVTCTGVDDVALIYLARDSLDAGRSAVALLYGAVGIGLLGGYVLLLRRRTWPSLVLLLLGGFAISSAGNLLTGLAWAVAAAFAAQFVRGFGISAIDVGVNTLFQREVPTEMLGRVFGTLNGAIGAAAAASYLLGAMLLQLTGPRATFVTAGIGGVLVTALTAVSMSRVRNPGVRYRRT